MLEVLRLVVAFDDGGGRIVPLDEGTEMSEARRSIGLCDENDVGAAEIFNRLPQESSRKHFMVVERIGGIDEQDVVERTQAEVLEAVVQDERVRLEVGDGVVATFDTVFVNDDDDSRPRRCREKVGCKHKWFVSSMLRIKKDFCSVRDNFRGKCVGVVRPFRLEPFKERLWLASISAGEDGDVPFTFSQRLGKQFDDRRLARSACREISDADDGASEFVLFQEGVLIKGQPQLRDVKVQSGQDEQETPENPVDGVGLPAVDDVNDILFGFFAEIVKGHL